MTITLKREIKVYPLHPEGGPYPSVLSEIQLHKGVETEYGIKDRLQLTFQTSEALQDHNDNIDDDRPMTVSVFVNATLSNKSRLMGYISQQVPKTELDTQLKNGTDIDIEALLIGTQWMLSVEHNEKDGRVYANLTNAMRAPDTQRIAIWKEDLGL